MATRILPSPTKHWLAKKLASYRPIPQLRFTPLPPTQLENLPGRSLNFLEELGEKYGTTKRYHDYLRHYWVHFRDIRESVRNVLEIGVETDRSVRMWREFFPNAVIHGLDIDPGCKAYEQERIQITIGDQSHPAILNQCLRKMSGPPEIIIDDGSHRPDHQILSMNYLFPRMAPRGIYVIEDTGGCVEDVRLRTVNRLKTLVDSVFYWPSGPNTHWTTLSKFPDSATWADRNMTGVAFYRWIVFVMRGQNPGDNPHLPLSPERIAADGLTPFRG